MERSTMTYEELTTRLATKEHIIPSDTKIVLGKLQNAEVGNRVYGIYKERDGLWYMYMSCNIGNKIQTFYLNHGTEEEMYDAIYTRVLNLEYNHEAMELRKFFAKLYYDQKN
jgi:hypothetical protein